MALYVCMLIATVFLGSEILAISTPVGQITLYRILALSLWPLLCIISYYRSSRWKINLHNLAWGHASVYLLWLIWGILSGVWALSLPHWIQGVFLLTVGVSSIVALTIFIRTKRQWYQALNVAWVMMSLLVLWGFFEVLTNIYLFADLEQLDPYNQFTSLLNRIPVTTFTNQNDYATLLIAYISLTVMKIARARHWMAHVICGILLLISMFLIYLTDSRMILLSVILYFIIFGLLTFRVDITPRHGIMMMIIFAISLCFLIVLIPSLRERVGGLFYIAGDVVNTGDTRRMNLWRNGLLFLGQTFGLGVGAGNVEYWMGLTPFFEVNQFTNLHNWWLEILVSYGGLVFLLYVLNYGMMIRNLQSMRLRQHSVERRITNSFVAFMIVFIFASITSANNMYIEWHWVYFGLLISYLNVSHSNGIEKEEVYDEFINSIA